MKKIIIAMIALCALAGAGRVVRAANHRETSQGASSTRKALRCRASR